MSEATTSDALIIGTGFGAMVALKALRSAGLEDIVFLERRAFLGGTWPQNSYPGAAVDVQSPLYSLAGEPWDWSRLYAERDELVAYTEHLLSKLGVRERAVTGADVASLEWSDDDQLWTASCRDGRVFRARYVVSASGPLSQPSVPEWPGQATFAGETWHTNAWRHDVPLAGKRVAVIGSGASAAQVIPAIAPEVEHLHVFQRTPHWVLPRRDRVLTERQRALMRWPSVYRLVRRLIYWSIEYRIIGLCYVPRLLDRMGRRPALRHLEDQVDDGSMREKLTPSYTIGCKRVIVSSTLFPALTRSNVTLHARDDAITAFTPEGVTTASDASVNVDIVVYATGYNATNGSIPYEVVGRGQTLTEAWSSFPRAYLGTTLPGFPNLFLIGGPNTGIGHTSALFVFESQARYIERCLRRSRASGCPIAPTAEAEERYTSWIHRALEGTVWSAGGCRSWYQGESGRVIAIFPGFSFLYRWMCQRFRLSDHVLG